MHFLKRFRSHRVGLSCWRLLCGNHTMLVSALSAAIESAPRESSVIPGCAFCADDSNSSKHTKHVSDERDRGSGYPCREIRGCDDPLRSFIRCLSGNGKLPQPTLIANPQPLHSLLFWNEPPTLLLYAGLPEVPAQHALRQQGQPSCSPRPSRCQEELSSFSAFWSAE